MALNDDIENLLTDFGLKLTTDTKSSLKKKLDERAAKHKLHSGVNRPKITSRLEASVLAEPIKFTSDSIKFTFVMNDYWDIVDGGRRPGNVSKEGQVKIAEWARTRGVAESIRLTDYDNRLDKQNEAKSKNTKRKKWVKLKKMPFDKAKKQAAFLVARSLKKKTIEPTNFFSEIIKDGRIEELQNKLSELIKTDIIINIV